MCQAYKAEANLIRWMEHRKQVREYEEQGERDAKAGKPISCHFKLDEYYEPWRELAKAYHKGWTRGSAGSLNMEGW